MNIYEKMFNIINDLSETKIEKKGYNAHAKFYYYELEDILNALKPILFKYKVLAKFDENGTILEYINIENSEDSEERLIYKIEENRQFEIQKQNDIQLIGAYATYIKRYNLLQSLLIDENDVVNATIKKDDVKKTNDKNQEEINIAVTVTDIKSDKITCITKNNKLLYVNTKDIKHNIKKDENVKITVVIDEKTKAYKLKSYQKI